MKFLGMENVDRVRMKENIKDKIQLKLLLHARGIHNTLLKAILTQQIIYN